MNYKGEKIKFIPVDNLTLQFSNCNNCEAKCCDGRHGTLFSQILLEDFEESSLYFPILFIFGELGFIRPIVLLSNGKEHCPYNEDFQCTIYNNRPQVCKNYPLSTDIDNKKYIDLNCPSLSQEIGEFIVKDGTVQNNFDNASLENYQDKFLKTYFFFEPLNKKENFIEVLEINGIKFYKYHKSITNKYIKFHHESLTHLDNKYFKN